MTRYIVIINKIPCFDRFYEDFIDPKNWDKEMTVIDLLNKTYTNDGINWIEIEENHL